MGITLADCLLDRVGVPLVDGKIQVGGIDRGYAASELDVIGQHADLGDAHGDAHHPQILRSASRDETGQPMPWSATTASKSASVQVRVRRSRMNGSGTAGSG